MTTTLSRWTVAIVVALAVLVGASLAVRAAATDDPQSPPAPVQQFEGGGGRIMFT
jgi:hypothetical protein